MIFGRTVLSELVSRLIYEEKRLYIHEGVDWVGDRVGDRVKGRGDPPGRTPKLSYVWRLTSFVQVLRPQPLGHSGESLAKTGMSAFAAFDLPSLSPIQIFGQS